MPVERRRLTPAGREFLRAKVVCLAIMAVGLIALLVTKNYAITLTIYGIGFLYALFATVRFYRR